MTKQWPNSSFAFSAFLESPHVSGCQITKDHRKFQDRAWTAGTEKKAGFIITLPSAPLTGSLKIESTIFINAVI